MVLYLADDVELDEALFEVRRAGAVVPLEPQAFNVLLYLVRHRDRIVAKEELMDSVWGGRFVSETAVTSRIKQVRKALGDDGQAQRCIRTLHGRGYRFVAEVVDGSTPAAAITPAADPAATVERPPVHYTVSDDLHIAYQVTGAGPVDIVLISGFVSHLDLDWDDPRHAHFLDKLGEMGRLIRFDKRGTGMSDRPPGVPDLETRMHDVLAVMDAVGSERAVLCGYSEGGPMAMLMAAMHPERVSALVLYGTYARRTWAEDYPNAQTDAERAAYTEELVTNWDWETDLRMRCPSGDDAMAAWWSRRMRAAATPGTIRALLDMNTLVDVRGVLPSLRVPTLVLHRRGDALFSWRGAQYLAERIPDARLEILPGDDHFVSGNPQQLIDAIEPFVRAAPEPAQPVALAAVAATAGPDADLLTQTLVGLGGRSRLTASGAPVLLFDGPATAARAAATSLQSEVQAGVGLAIAEVPTRSAAVSGPGVEAALDLANRAPSGQLLISQMASLLLSGSGIETTTYDGADDAYLVPSG